MSHGIDENPENTFDFHVIRDISADEELCVAYIHPFMARAERQTTLQLWGFVCACSACEDTDEGHEKEKIFVAMSALYHELENKSLEKMNPDDAAVIYKRRLPKL